MIKEIKNIFKSRRAAVLLILFTSPFITGCPQQFVGMMDEMEKSDSVSSKSRYSKYLNSD